MSEKTKLNEYIEVLEELREYQDGKRLEPGATLDGVRDKMQTVLEKFTGEGLNNSELSALYLADAQKYLAELRLPISSGRHKVHQLITKISEDLNLAKRHDPNLDRWNLDTEREKVAIEAFKADADYYLGKIKAYEQSLGSHKVDEEARAEFIVLGDEIERFCAAAKQYPVPAQSVKDKYDEVLNFDNMKECAVEEVNSERVDEDDL